MARSDSHIPLRCSYPSFSGGHQETLAPHFTWIGTVWLLSMSEFCHEALAAAGLSVLIGLLQLKYDLL
jgi:hypothetical protein